MSTAANNLIIQKIIKTDDGIGIFMFNPDSPSTKSMFMMNIEDLEDESFKRAAYEIISEYISKVKKEGDI